MRKHTTCTLATLALAMLLTGCVTSQPPAPSAALPERYNLPAAPRQLAPTPEGTIFNASSNQGLYTDSRAHAVGDIILVKIVETSNGSKKASTKAGRNSSVTADTTALFGFEKWLAANNKNFTPSSKSLQLGLTNDFEGDGETKRDSSVTATISARVVEVTMDNNLVIRGFREVRLNNETQHIILSGLVRPRDIAQDNSILSSYIADARIEYSGTGIISDKQQPGWLARGLDVIWPF
ncbi:MAG: flagellar basal body L-ring protein FlgH [Desulfobulbaceae bacterium]|nr:flagellar basal body L-ring protein FlgH [Desulfobulbaceae bacterium]